MAENKLDIIAANGVPFRVVFLADGQSVNFPAASANQALVEFYDRRYDFTADGQFTGGRYYASTLLDDPRRGGLRLQGGVPEWTVDSDTMDTVMAWIAERAAE